MSILVAGILGIIFFGSASLIYLGIATIVGIMVSAFVSLLINNSLWSFWYNKERDRVLTRRIDAEKKRIEAKNNKNKQNDEKIVV
jgi:preprotein translocase subunit SecF